MDAASTPESRPASRILDAVVANLMNLGALALTLVLVGAAFYD